MLNEIAEERLKLIRGAVPTATYSDGKYKFGPFEFDTETERRLTELVKRYEARSNYIINFYKD